MTGTLALTMSGTGMQTLSGANITYTGATSVSNGTLALQDTTAFASAITVNASGTLNAVRTVVGVGSRSAILGNAITGSGIININNSGSGIAGGWTTVNGATSSLNFSGTINVNSGVFARDNTNVTTINGTATVNVAAGAAFGTGTAGNSTIGALNGAGEVSTLWSNASAGSITVGNGGGSGTFSGNIDGNGTNATDGTIEGGVLSFIKTGAGTETLSGTNTYSGGTTVNGGVLLQGVANALGSTSGALTVNTGGTLDLGGFALGVGNLTGTGGTITDTGAGAILTIGNNNAGGGNYAGVIQDGTGALTLTKIGTANITLSGTAANTYGGLTTVTNGALILSKTAGVAAIPGNLAISSNANVWFTANNQLGGASTIVSNGNNTAWAALTLLGTTQTIAGMNNSNNTLMVADATTSQTPASPSDAGTGTLILVGSGTYSNNGDVWDHWGGSTGQLALTVNLGTGGVQTLSGPQIIYTGATIVNSGQLILLNATAYNSPTTINSGGKLSWSGTTTVSTLSPGAAIALNSGGTLEDINPANWLVLNSVVTNSGTTTINESSNATLVAGEGFFLDSGLQGTGTVTINATNAGNAVNFRNNNSTFSGTLIVNGIASTSAFAGSGIGVGGDTTGLQNADIQLNGTMELLNQGLGWANTTNFGASRWAPSAAPA